MTNLSEAFTKLKLIESEDFDLLDKEGKDAFKDFLAEDEEENVEVEVFDPEVYEEEELQDSYLDKIVCQCPVCKSLVFKGWDEYEEMDEEVSCPYCFSVEHFDTIGKIVPIEDETKEEIEVEETVEESCDAEPVKESLETVTVETDNEVINISSEEKSTTCEECEEPIEEHETVEVIAPIEDSIDIDEIDEESFDEMVESWLKESFKKIKNYKSVKFMESRNRKNIYVEGVVTLGDHSRKKTTFTVRPGKLNESMGTKVMVKNNELGIKKVFGARVQK